MKTLSKSLRPVLLVFFISGSIGITAAFAQLSNLTNDYIPPCPDSIGGNDPQYVGSFHQNYGGTVDLTEANHSGFTNCFPPPANIGDSTTHFFGSTAKAIVHVTGGPTFTMNAPAQVTVKVRMTNQSGNIRYFSNEMIQLDISGGNLPTGTLIRESPLKASAGQTSIEDVGGLYTITSFFDVWTDLSLDGGTTWTPADTSGRMTLSSYPVSSPDINDEGYSLSLSPNPFSSRCNISFSVLKTTIAKLEVFDLSGKQIAILFHNDAQPGTLYHVEFDGGDFPEGFYICKFTSGNKSAYRRMVMLR